MYGAIIGDVAGSTYEVREVEYIKNKEKVPFEEKIKVLDKRVPLFLKNSSTTDDTVLTCAIADAILNGGNYEQYLMMYGRREVNLGFDIYGRSRFGKGFISWLDDKSKNNSSGNGCAMRISPIGLYFDDVDEVRSEAYKATITSHNHEESILCATAVAISICLAKKGYSKYLIKKYIEKEFFSLDFNLDDLQHNYAFKSKAINSVPHAIFCFLESTDFEDSIRKAISIGGDTDTIAAITGSISEAYYGIPNHLIKEVEKYIPDNYKDVIEKFYNNKNIKKLCLRRD